MEKRLLHVDIETYSEVDIGACGSFRYMDDPSFEVMLIAYAFNDEDVRVIDLTSSDLAVVDVFEKALYDPDTVKVAHNAAFERYAFQHLFHRYCPPEEWLDTMILSSSCGLPLALGQVSDALGLPKDTAKDKAGRDLIRLFCTPHKPTKSNPSTRIRPEDEPEKWAQFIEYNRQDVVAERTIYHKLKRWLPDEIEHRIWCLDARINERGIRADRQLVMNAEAMGTRYKETLTEDATALTGLDNPNSVAQIKEWLLNQEGVDIPSLNKKVIADVMSKLQNDASKKFLELRKELAKSSVKKYDAILRSMGEDDHVRGCFQFFGTHTGRWAGRLVQLQNLPQNHMPDLAECRELVRRGDYDTVLALYDSISAPLSELIRTALIPEPGEYFVVSDFSAIEARVTAWFANEEWRLEAFREGKDIYCESASQAFKVPVVKHGINGELRQKGKIMELACGYGGGVGAMKAFGADKMGMTEEEMGENVAKWRDASPNICAMWRKLERAADLCASRCTTEKSGVRDVTFQWENDIMWMTLPSGRRMAYVQPRYEESTRRNGKTLSYMGLNQVTRKWERVETWGGKLTENLVQATARDILRDKMLALDLAGYDIRGSVHDEVIITTSGLTALDEVNEIMCAPVAWALGLPLDADGYACDFYMKA